jgi:uncharacterized protein YvpB
MTAIAKVNSAAASKSPASSLPATVREGSKGAAVTKLQQDLAHAGYYKNHVDGVFGAKTRAAVIAFQKAHHLKEDGVVGPKTWAALLGTSSAKSSSGTSGTKKKTTPATTTRQLNVPFTDQFAAKDGYGEYACAPTSLYMALKYAGAKPASLTQVCQRAGTHKDYSGTSPAGISAAAKSYGKTPHVSSGWASLRAAIAQGKPAIVHINTTPLSNKPYKYDGGHYILVTGLVTDSKGNITQVICNDPGSYRGHAIHYSASQFEKAWSEKGRWMMHL